MRFVAPTTRGAEGVLAAELSARGLAAVEGRGIVRFEGDLTDGYTACLWSRIASRVLLVLEEVSAQTPDDLYEGVQAIPWAEHIDPRRSLAVHFVGTSETIRNSRFGALRTKDGIVDRLRADTGTRPSVDLRDPDVRVHVHLAAGRATVAIDLAGEALYKRGYGRVLGPAPLKESLAAALLHIAGWPEVAAAGGTLVDPMCGSGTLLEEAAGIALGRAPGLTRPRWGFEGWRGHDPQLWRTLLEEAREGAETIRTEARILGSDIHPRAVDCARKNAQRARVAGLVRLQQADFLEVDVPSGTGLMVTNPPYGERLHAGHDVVHLYRDLGDVLRRRWLGWTAYILAGSPQLGRQVGLKPARRVQIHNGPIDCRFLEVPISKRPVQRLAD